MNNDNEYNNITLDTVKSQPTAPQSTSSDVKRFLRGSVKLTGKYILAKLLSSLCMAVLGSIAFKLIGIPLPVLMGIIAGVCNLIPVVGEWGSVIGIALFAFAFEPVDGLWALLAMIALQGLDGYIITPAIAGQALNIKPALIVLVTIAAGFAFGAWGVLISVPLAAIIKLGFDIFYFSKRARSEMNQDEKK